MTPRNAAEREDKSRSRIQVAVVRLSILELDKLRTPKTIDVGPTAASQRYWRWRGYQWARTSGPLIGEDGCFPEHPWSQYCPAAKQRPPCTSWHGHSTTTRTQPWTSCGIHLPPLCVPHATVVWCLSWFLWPVEKVQDWYSFSPPRRPPGNSSDITRTTLVHTALIRWPVTSVHPTPWAHSVPT